MPLEICVNSSVLVSMEIKMTIGYCPKCKEPCTIIFRRSKERKVNGVEIGVMHSKRPMPIPINHSC